MTATFPERPILTSDLIRSGMTRRQVDVAIAQGTFRRLLRGVVAPGQLEDTLDLRVRAVTLALGPGQVAIDRTAAWIHGVNTLTLEEATVPPRVECAVAPDHHPTERCDVLGRQRTLRLEDVMRIDGLLVTTPLRTALDLGCNLRRREAFAALNEFARVHGIDQAALWEQVPYFRGRRGVVQLKSLIPLVEARVESPRESWTLLAIVDAGIECPEPQVWVIIDGVPTYRLDFAWRRKKVAVEYDGVAAHLMTEEQRRADEVRRRILRELGWTIIVIGNGAFHGRALDQWLSALRGALAAPPYSPLRFRPTA